MVKKIWKSDFAAGVLIVLTTVAAYWPALKGGFVWDDDAYVTKNSLLTATDGLWRIWFSAHSQSQYFPLVFTTLRLERGLWGMNPLGYHAVNVLLHCANVLLVWAVLRRLALPGAWLAAAIWALHPVQVESVAWITELKNVQSTLFYLLALLAWMKFTDKQASCSWRFYFAALGLYALALFSKTTACTLPAALLLVLWMRNDPIDRRRIAQVTPFIVMGVAMGLVSVWWESHLGNYGEEVKFSFSVYERLLIAGHALWFYAAKLVWPVALTFSYPRWEVNVHAPASFVWVIGCVLVAWVLWWKRKTVGRGAVAAVIFYVATLSPLLGFIPLYTFRYSFVADHYQYVASLGLIALFAATLSGRLTAGAAGFYWRWAMPPPLLLLLGVLTWRQAGIYQNLETLWHDTLAKNPACWMAHNNLGSAYLDRGQLNEAEAEFTAALRINPQLAAGYYNLAGVLEQKGRHDDAVRNYQEAIRLKPNYAEAHNNLGNILAMRGELDEAVVHFRAALEYKPDYANAHSNLGVILAAQGKYAEAIPHYREALRLEPDSALMHNNLGYALMQIGRLDGAVAQLGEALRLNPNYARAHFNLGVALAGQQKLEQAITQYREALRLKPDYTEAKEQLRALGVRVSD